MKPTALILSPVLLIALLSGCSAGLQPAEAPKPEAQKTARVEEPAVVLPQAYSESAPPGSMDFAWEPAEAPPPKEVRPRELDAKPHFVTDKKKRGRLFVLPTRFSH